MIARAIWAEAIGSFLLFACVIGSGVMGDRLSGGNVAVALLGNALATGAMLYDAGCDFGCAFQPGGNLGDAPAR